MPYRINTFWRGAYPGDVVAASAEEIAVLLAVGHAVEVTDDVTDDTDPAAGRRGDGDDVPPDVPDGGSDG